MKETLEMMEGADKGFGINYGWCVIQSFGGDCQLWGTVTLDEDELKSYLMAHAIASLPPGTRYELRRKMPSNYNRSFGMAWYHTPAMANLPDWGYCPKEPQRREGFYFIGEYVTPASITVGSS